jgi:ribosomal protein S21
MLFTVFLQADFKRKSYSTLVLKIHKKIRKTRKFASIREKHLLERKNEGRKPDKNSSLRRLEFRLRNLKENAVQEFYLHLSGFNFFKPPLF